MNYGDSHFPTAAEQGEYTEREQDARACAQRGIEWLDQHIPDWRDNVDPPSIEMYDSEYCVLAQAAEQEYSDALRTYKLDPHADAIRLGFAAPTSILKIGVEWGTHGYDELDAAWKELLRATTD